MDWTTFDYDAWLQERRMLFSAMAVDGLPEEQKTFLLTSQRPQGVMIRLEKALEEGMLPSAFIQQEMAWVFERYILPENRDTALRGADLILNHPYSGGLARRSFRTSEKGAYAQKIQRHLHHAMKDSCAIFPLADILTAKIPEKALNPWLIEDMMTFVPMRITLALQDGDAHVEALVRDILLGEGDQRLLRPCILGVLQSDRTDLYELVGKLLVAARLQEGLRQVICEAADMGTEAAFRYLVDVIDDNDLIRFSGVKRAMGCWLGLLQEHYEALDHISAKTMALVRGCLEDEGVRNRCLAGENAMEIYIALWSLGVHDVTDSARQIERLSREGSHHQQLTAGVFLANAGMTQQMARLGCEVALAHPEALDLQAVYLPMTLSVLRRMTFVRNEVAEEAAYALAQIRQLYDHLVALRPKVGKELVFKPCIFPWYSTALKKTEVAAGILFAASCLGRDDLLDEALPLLTDCDADDRELLIRKCLTPPRTPRQRETVLRALCDKSEWVQRVAADIVDRWTLTAEDYGFITGLLRYKYARPRQAITGFLLRQEDDALLNTIRILLADKNAEKRMAGLSIIDQLKKQGKRSALVNRCSVLLNDPAEDKADEKHVIQGIHREEKPLYDKSKDVYSPVLEMNDALRDAVQTFMRVFPESSLAEELDESLKGKIKAHLKDALQRRSVLKQTEEDLRGFITLFNENLLTPVPEYDGKLLNELRGFACDAERVPLKDLWVSWYRDALGSDPVRVFRMYVRLGAGTFDIMARALGKGWEVPVEKLPAFSRKDAPEGVREPFHMVMFEGILRFLSNEFFPGADRPKIATALLCWMAMCLTESELWVRYHYMQVYPSLEHLIESSQVQAILASKVPRDEALLKLQFDARWCLLRNSRTTLAALPKEDTDHYLVRFQRDRVLSTGLVMRSVCRGMISREAFYAWLMEGNEPSAVAQLLFTSGYYRSQGRETENYRRSWAYDRTKMMRNAKGFLGHEPTDSEEDQSLLRQADEMAQTFLAALVDAEVHRSDAPGSYSGFVPYVCRLDGAEHFVRLLSALGKANLVRHEGLSYSGRLESICKLLSVCAPARTDTPERFRTLLKEYAIPQKRLIEMALYCPEWLSLLEEAAGIPGLTCAAYYFIAHMNEWHNEARQARIARYTPLTMTELQQGAFDMDWFQRAYREVGEKVFDQLYAAAKYIATGATHTRARKYADAALGRTTLEQLATHIREKRNQDALKAYPLVPLNGDADVQARYLFIQNFCKESKQFGAQRIASEKLAAEVALTNLARNAGYADAMRLTLRMEAGLIEEFRPLMQPRDLGDVTVCLTIDRSGMADVSVEKAGKALKSIPAKYKKDPCVVQLHDARKRLTEQHRRTRAMLETAMEDETVFTAGELAALMGSEVIAPMLRTVLLARGEEIGLFDGQQLERADGTFLSLSAEDEVCIVHPYLLWKQGQWLTWQKRLYAAQMVQPFRQVFREVYVPTQDEISLTESMRYAGHQVQPGKAASCLKQRRWVADAEAGLQKVDYRRNIVAVMVAMGDWFTPADIEAPTLEHIIFLDRMTNKLLTIAEVPPVFFSEVMRDIDLAVSVAHVGGVDPEASHATIEMRAALLNLTLPLFHLTNVEVRERHAVIQGTLAQYTVHLGSGTVHQVGGTMLNILPVHSAHRGRIFLPFADNDPQTAEVLSKVLLLAEDQKLRDPTILEQIRQDH